jgi:para-nitrobenzyl esterase
MSRSGVAALVIGALGASSAVAYAAVERAEITGGKVEGVATNGIASFKGVPFAAPPVGDNRWRSPQAVMYALPPRSPM